MRNLVGGTVLVITIAMNSAAFISEVIRGGLLAVDKGQREAALSIGLSSECLQRSDFATGVCSSISVIGEFIYFHDKNTAIGFTIGVVDILAQAKIWQLHL